ncbi:MAG: deoxyribodipyrimidine photolyase [Acidobacteria bacterium]|nr:MAG: deoxyribodipyrimidine photolyase [Acidobacteriota bacterium]
MTMPSTVPALRVRRLNRAPVEPAAEYVLYWMTASRRTRWNFALERAADYARALARPLVVFEALRADYRWASDRLHRFVIEGMADNARRLSRTPAAYFPYVEPRPGHGKGLLAALGRRAAVVVSDDFPSFFLPRMLGAAAEELAVRLEAVDSNGLLPVAAADRIFKRAVDFRRFLQRTLPGHLGSLPRRNPLLRARLPRLDRLPPAIVRRWRPARLDLLLAGGLARLPIDHRVPPVAYAGGAVAAEAQLRRFLDRRLPRYAGERNALRRRATSGLSPYLHFGHLSSHQIFHRLAARENWDPGAAGGGARGARSGWWGMSASAESFLDQLVTWRELGYNMSARDDGCERYESLPPWARATLEAHLADRRPYLYELEDFERAATHDELWNAAQRELLRDGRIHNYLRMLWGKKILHWTATPEDALAVMIELNNKYAVDGRNPNSASGIFWCLGRYDRAWGPERPVFGKVRYMSSKNARRKLDVASYLAAYGT